MGSFIGGLEFQRKFDMAVTLIYDCIWQFYDFFVNNVKYLLKSYCSYFVEYIIICFLFLIMKSSNKAGNKYLIYWGVLQWCIQLSCFIAHILDTNREYTKCNFVFNEGHENVLHILCFTFCKRKA